MSAVRLWGIHKRYKSLSWWVNFMGGHISIGPITIYGANAMRWAVNIRTKRWGYICFTLPVAARWEYERHYGEGPKVYRWYFYLSPNATPQCSTFYRGSDKNEVIRAQIRKMNFGHAWKANDPELQDKNYALNERFDRFAMCDYQMIKWGRTKTQYA